MARPRSYDEEALLDAAMERFWSRGYEQTSIRDLVRETGVNRASLYNAYPDKKGLFLAALRHYLDGVTADGLRRLRQGEPVTAIRRFFSRLVEAQGRGCLLTNSAVELGPADPEVAALLRNAFGRVEQGLAARLTEAQQAGRLSPELDPKAYARHLLVLIQGLRVMTRAGLPKAMLRDAVDSALAPLE